MDDDHDITAKVLLDHLRAMEQRLVEKVTAVQGDVRGLQKDVRSLQQDVRSVQAQVGRLEVNLTAQIDAIDQRLDAVENETLPQRVAALETTRR